MLWRDAIELADKPTTGFEVQLPTTTTSGAEPQLPTVVATPVTRVESQLLTTVAVLDTSKIDDGKTSTV